MQGLIIAENEIRVAANEDLIHATLERLFFIELGNMIGALTKGSRILDYLDEPATEATASAIIEETSNLVSTFEPRIVLEGAGVDLVPDGGTIGVINYVAWHFVDQSEEVTYETLVQKIFVVS